MNYKYRTYLYKILNIFPDNLGYYLYHALQSKLSKSSISLKIREAESSFRTIKTILDKNNVDIENSQIIEIGSGWVPLIPYLLILKGNAGQVDTYDINEHFNSVEIDYINRYYDVRKIAISEKYNLLEKVHYHPKKNVIDGNLSRAEIVFSQFVLEHVPPEIIKKMHEDFAKKLKPGSHILHLISPSDHRSYSDPSLSLVDFLQYSQKEWDAIQTKFDYHNRLRLPQYLEILGEHFEILHLEHDVSKPGTNAYDKFKKVKLHPDFNKYSETEIIAGSINILLKKKIIMKLTLIICTYKRPEALKRLLDSVKKQTYYPDEILVVDGSPDDMTSIMLADNLYPNLTYFLVEESFRGLTKQRNFGIRHVDSYTQIIAFLDDDTELLPDYFSELINTFETMPDVSGVGGIAVNENAWFKPEAGKKYNKNQYYRFEDFIVKEGQRNIFRNILGLESNLGPGQMPEYSHGRTCGFPLNGKTYEVDLLIGMSFAFRRKVFDKIQFSTFFEGYGLYEDADFSIKALRFGKNVINTKLQLFHFHHPSGRPNQYKYGKMVVRNGWYVWRIKNANPSFKAKVKWNLITLLLTLIRFMNTFTTSSRKKAFTEALGRTVGWWSLFFNKPKLHK